MTRKAADLEIGVPGESIAEMEEGGGELGDGIEEEVGFGGAETGFGGEGAEDGDGGADTGAAGHL